MSFGEHADLLLGAGFRVYGCFTAAFKIAEIGTVYRPQVFDAKYTVNRIRTSLYRLSDLSLNPSVSLLVFLDGRY